MRSLQKMRPNALVRTSQTAQRGFGVISAIFLLVVLSALGAAMVRLSAVQHTGSALDVQGTRAYQAARAGIEWGLYQALIGNPSPSCPAAPTSFVPPAPTLSSFTVTVICVDANYADPPIRVRQIKSTACNQPDNSGNCAGEGGKTDYVQRVLQVTF
jgi:MSHA biogenesis protein MshP